MSLLPVYSPTYDSEVPFPSISGLRVRLRADLGITKDGSDLVSAWADQSGNGLNFTQATGGHQPLWLATSGTGQPIVRFDGSTDNINTGTISSQAAPHHFFIVFKQLYWGDNEYIYVNNTTGVTLEQNPTANQVSQYNGTNPLAADLTNYWLHRNFLNGSASSAALNDDTPNVVTALTQACTLMSLGGLTNGTLCANVEIAEFVWYDAEVTGTDLSNILAYFSSRYGIF